MKLIASILPVLLFLMTSCNDNNDNPGTEDMGNTGGTTAPTAPTVTYNTVTTYPHDTSSFTQGLAFWKGKFYEGTGEYGFSRLKQVDLATGKTLQEVTLPDTHFGEGITILNDTIYQLTWKEKVVHVYSAKDLKKIKEFPINTEGWGITHNGKELIVSDGSSNLYFYDPATFQLLRIQGVTNGGMPAGNLNELEFINGAIYANQWQTNYIYKIDPASGTTLARLDLTAIANSIRQRFPQADVLNGIAYNPENNKIYVTGKKWPELYELQFEH